MPTPTASEKMPVCRQTGTHYFLEFRLGCAGVSLFADGNCLNSVSLLTELFYLYLHKPG